MRCALLGDVSDATAVSVIDEIVVRTAPRGLADDRDRLFAACFAISSIFIPESPVCGEKEAQGPSFVRL